MGACKTCNGNGWYFVNEWFMGIQGRRDCKCVQSAFKKDYVNARVVASNSRLKEIGVEENLCGKTVQVYDIDRFESVYGPSSMVRVDNQFDALRVKGTHIDYIIPTRWLRFD